MSEEKKNSKLSFLDNFNFLKKIKQVKHIGLIIAVIFLLILAIIFFGDFSFSSSTSGTTQSTSTYTNADEYVKSLENRLKNVLSQIKGAGNVEVMISVDNGIEFEIAIDTESSSISKNGETTTTTSSKPIIITNDGQQTPIIISENLPTITGVVIVSSGANDVFVKLNLLSATETLLNISQNDIQIFVGK